ncbi:MAG: FAD-dependent oxidoreductase [Saprospiraceae bacterium]|nr:FAD-dependent oxidoreductase [Saprospiraceae bacterium]
MKPHPVLVVGAGIAGLSAAQRLAAANIPTIVLDKGRGVGGRMATRRIGEAVFDHGAQYFSAKTPDFQEFVNGAVKLGIAREWWPAIADNKHPRWVGSHGMNAVPKLMAESCTVLKEKKVVKIQMVGDAWQVMTDDAGSFLASALLVTIPAPQALELLENSGIHFAENPLTQIKYHPCLALLATLDSPSSIPAPGGLQINGAVVSWLADNFKKGISKHPSVTIHGSPTFSQKHLDGDLQAAGAMMLEVVADLIQPAQVLDWQIHRWRYSLAYERYPSMYFEAETASPLLFGGDGFGMGNVEGAFVSGLAMADYLLEGMTA